MTGVKAPRLRSQEKRMFETIFAPGGGEEAKCEKAYALVVFGASGFTGKLVALHVAQHGPSGLRWALGGRDKGKLEKLRRDLVDCRYAIPPAGIVVGDLRDVKDCCRIAETAKCVLTTCGPYDQYGRELVKACANVGTNYVDITGEAVPFVRDSLDLDAIAKKTGATIAHCCGFDSVPSDLLAKLAIEAIEARGERCQKCVVALEAPECMGGFSGGTIASGIGIMRHVLKHPKDFFASLDQDVLCPQVKTPSSPSKFSFSRDLLNVGSFWWLLLPGYDSLLGAWHAPFVMAWCNQKVVRLSCALRKETTTEYKEVMTPLPLGGGNWGVVGLVVAVVTWLSFNLLTTILFVVPSTWLPRPGTGPSRKERLGGSWSLRVAARGDTSKVVGRVVAQGQDPGYGSTAAMAAECALSLVSDGAPAGLVSPSVACPGLPARLKAFGITFSLKVDDDDKKDDRSSPLFGRKTTLCLGVAGFVVFLFIRLVELVSVFRDSPAAIVVFFLGALVASAGYVFFFSSDKIATSSSSSKKRKRSFLFPFAAASKETKAVMSLVVVALLLSLTLDRVLLWRPPQDLDVRGKTFAITGGNSGLGFALGKELASAGASVILLCRSPLKCQRAAADIGGEALSLDLADLRSVAEAAKALRRTKLDGGLVLNAGYFPNPHDGLPEKTVQGLDMAFGTMHVGHALLTKMVGSRADKVVVVSSESHHLAASGLFPSDTCDKRTYNAYIPGFYCAYPRAKLANVYFAMTEKNKLRRQRSKKKVVVVVAPGFVRSGIIKGALLKPFFQLCMRPTRLGIRGMLRALIDDDVDGTLLDSMARPRSFDDSCFFSSGCDLDDARTLEDTTKRLIELREPADEDDEASSSVLLSEKKKKETLFPPSSEEEEEEEEELWWKVALRYLAWSSFLCWVGVIVVTFYGVIFLKKAASPEDPAPQGPGPFLELVNAVAQAPAVAPFVDACFWAWSLFLGGLLAPVGFVYGLFLALRNLLVVSSSSLFSKNKSDDDKKNLGVVITGCDTGFGRSLVVELCSRGYTVFAGCYQRPTAGWLQAIGDDLVAADGATLPIPLRLDVTSDLDVVEAKATVDDWLSARRPDDDHHTGDSGENNNNEEANSSSSTKKKRRLLCVVNNAGIGGGGFAEMSTEDDLRRVMEVNYVGVARVSRAFLPLLRSGLSSSSFPTPPPRIVVVASMASKSPMEMGAAYCASKHAVRAYAAVLRLEQQVPVCTVLPTFHRTPLLSSGATAFDEFFRRASPEIQRAYGGHETVMAKKLAFSNLAHGLGWDPQRVVDVLVDAATSPNTPPREIPVGLDARYLLQLLCRFSPAAAEASAKSALV